MFDELGSQRGTARNHSCMATCPSTFACCSQAEEAESKEDPSALTTVFHAKLLVCGEVVNPVLARYGESLELFVDRIPSAPD